MMTLRAIILLIILINSGVSAEPTSPPEGGVELTKGVKLQPLIGSKLGSSSVTDEHVSITVTKPDTNSPYLAQFMLNTPSSGIIPKGSRVLASIRARVVGAEAGVLAAKFQHKGPPYTMYSPISEVKISPEWREYHVLLIANADIPAGSSQLALLCAQKAQTIEISSAVLRSYPASLDTRLFPRVRATYAGREADAPWRKEALERIEKTRKKSLTATILTSDGKQLANTTVTLDLTRHAFGFGSAVPVKWILDPSPDGDKFRDVIDKNFSMVVFENDLKDFAWNASQPADQLTKKKQNLDKAFDWLAKRHIAVRGHYLMQTATSENLRGKPAADIRTHLLESTRSRIAFAGDRVIAWDAINHPIAWGGADMLTQIKGLENIEHEVLTLASSLTKLPLMVNEDQLFRPGRQSDDTFTFLQKMKAAGHKISGLGNQAHFDETFLPSPMEILKTTDHFATVTPTQIITEFDVVTNEDEQLAADYTRDVMIATFSHPAYHGFLIWGFWESSHWKPEAASWNKDWTIKPRGKIFTDLITKTWHTKVTVTTDAQGQATWHGFPGHYTPSSPSLSNLPLVLAK